LIDRTIASIVVLLGLVAVLLAGCGGDTRRGEAEQTEATSPSGATATPAFSPAPAAGQVQVAKVTDPGRRAYVKRVDAVCRQIEPERAKEQERVGGATKPDEAVKAYEGSIALGWRELRRIEAIAEPPGDAPLLKANVIAPIRGQLALRARIRDALAAADVPLLRRLRAELDNSTRALTGFARGYGFRVCGEE
jgi:hypothetical protein